MAQNITGIVIDNNHKPVEFATIVLLNQQDSTYITGGITDTSGYFSLQSQKTGLLKVSCLGFDDKYLLFFEKYMEALQNVEASILNQVVLAVILLIISPLIICRPYFAWISSLQGLNASMRKAFRKTEGNYGNFMLIMLILNIPCLIVYELDMYLECHGWLSVGFYSIFFIYLNLVFAKLYEFFYND